MKVKVITHSHDHFTIEVDGQTIARGRESKSQTPTWSCYGKFNNTSISAQHYLRKNDCVKDIKDQIARAA